VKRQARVNEINDNWHEIIPQILDFEDRPDRDSISDRLREYYLPEQNFADNTLLDISRLYSDRMFKVPLHEAVALHTIKTKTPIYTYYFTYEGNSGLTSILQRMWGLFPFPRYLEFTLATVRRWITGHVDPESIEKYGMKRALHP
jgi:hypothetical protein